MKKLVFFVVLFLGLVGCSQKDIVNFEENTTLIVEERVGDELTSDYVVINEIQDKDIIQNINKKFRSAKWDTNTDISMEHEPDYKLNDNCHIWITPEGNKLEIIIRNNNYYTLLSEEASSELLKIITNEDL
ncbi:hypothetical protein [Ornithinibacillus sp. JPR2-1]|uniref:hypothetical protein n=1 Tax=Ornithinibacillus sp. JPR2-1 TaxID=2094019 RepID=UPI0031D61F1A